MKLTVRSGIFILSTDDMACFITAFNLYKDINFVQNLKEIQFEGARCAIYTVDYSNVHSLVKTLINANYIGDIDVIYTQNPDFKEDVVKPVLSKLMFTNNSIIHSYGSLFTPKGYQTVNAINPDRLDYYLLDTNNSNTQIIETTVYNVRGRKLHRYTIPNLRQV